MCVIIGNQRSTDCHLTVTPENGKSEFKYRVQSLYCTLLAAGYLIAFAI